MPANPRQRLFEPIGDELDDIPAQKCQRFAGDLQGPAFCPHRFGDAAKLGRARDKRHQIEAESLRDLAVVVLARIALAIRTVAPDDDAALDEVRQMPPERRGEMP